MTHAPTSYHFGACTLHTASREVLLHGVPHSLAPKVFDLLVHLIEHRDRVVSKEELLDKVWGGAVVSEGVIANAVLKAREAVGDRGEAHCIIKTVHRVGYRWMAPVELLGGGERHAPAPAAAAPARVRLALMPFENRTGDSQLGWMELGLLSLVNQALEQDARLSVCSVATVLKALELAPADASAPARADTVRRLTGVDWVASASFEAQDGAFSLACTLGCTNEPQLHAARITGSELTALGQQLAKVIETRLFPGGAQAVAFECRDPLANQAYARALQAFAQGNNESALKLLQVVLDIEPDSAIVRLSHLTALWRLGDKAVLAAGRALLAQAVAAGNQRVAASAHTILAWACHQSPDHADEGVHHHDEALRLVQGEPDADWAQEIHFYAGALADFRGDHKAARTILSQVARASRSNGNRLGWVRSTMVLSCTLALKGELQEAGGLFEQVLAESIELGNLKMQFIVHSNLAECQSALGRLGVGLRHCDAAFHLLPRLQRDISTPGSISSLCARYAEAGRLQAIDELLAATVHLMTDVRDLNVSHAAAAAAQRCVCLGDMAEAARLLASAVDGVMAAGYVFHARQYGALLIHTQMLAGRHAEAQDTAARLLGSPGLQAMPELLGMRWHAKALLAHSLGDAAAARDHLGQALAVLQPGRWCALARLDAASMDLDRGDLQSAAEQLQACFRWPDEHPAGMAVQARLQALLGAGAGGALPVPVLQGLPSVQRYVY